MQLTSKYLKEQFGSDAVHFEREGVDFNIFVIGTNLSITNGILHKSNDEGQELICYLHIPTREVLDSLLLAFRDFSKKERGWISLDAEHYHCRGPKIKSVS